MGLIWDARQTVWWRRREGPGSDLECVSRRIPRLDVAGKGGEGDHRGDLWTVLKGDMVSWWRERTRGLDGGRRLAVATAERNSYMGKKGSGIRS